MIYGRAFIVTQIGDKSSTTMIETTPQGGQLGDRFLVNNGPRFGTFSYPLAMGF